MLIVKALLAFVSAASLAALVGYAVLVWSRFGRVSSSVLDANSATWKGKAFLALAALGLLVCLYTGSEALLYWLPNSWGGIDEDGEFRTFRSALAGVFTIIIAGPLIYVLEEVPKESFSFALLRDEVKYEREIHATVSPSQLDALRSRLGAKIDELSKEFPEGREVPEGTRRQIVAYERLVRLVEKKKSMKFIDMRNGQLLGLAPQVQSEMDLMMKFTDMQYGMLPLAHAEQIARLRGVSWHEIQEIRGRFTTAFNNAKGEGTHVMLWHEALAELDEKGDEAIQEELSALEELRSNVLGGEIDADEEEDEAQFQSWLVQWERQLGRHFSV